MRKVSFEYAEVAAHDSFDRCDCLCIGEVVGIERTTQSLPMSIEDKEEFFTTECAVSVGKSDTAVELWVVTESLVYSGQSNEDYS